MNFFDHLISFLLAVLLHVLVLLVVGNRSLHNAMAAAAAPELEVTSVELTLAEAETAAPAAQKTEDRGQRTEVPELKLPEPVAPAPAEEMPDKPDFTEALTPPPELQPQPSPVVTPPAKVPDIAPSAGRRPPASSPAPTPAVPQATIQPAGSGGGGGATGRVDAHPSLERAIKPTYPIGSRRRGEEGTVILDVTVGPDGHATQVARVSSSGFPELDRAAERAAAQARFKPGTRDGKSVESAARLTLIFRLRDQ